VKSDNCFLFKVKGVLLIPFFLPFIFGWVSVDLTDHIEYLEDKASITEPVSLYEKSSTQMSPYRIMQKLVTALYSTNSMVMDVESWMQNGFAHSKSDYSYLIYNLQDFKADGRASYSSLIPGFNFSSSYWVQLYQVRGMPFFWDYMNKKWIEQEFRMGDYGDAFVEIFLTSLFGISEGTFLSDELYLLGEDIKNGKECFVIRYPIDSSTFEKDGFMGDMEQLTWVDKNTFLPVASRSEGYIGDSQILNITNYREFNLGFPMEIESVVYKRVNEAKDKILFGLDDLIKNVAMIRGWPELDNVKLKFTTERGFRDVMTEVIDDSYEGVEGVEYEELIMKWLGLVKDDLDYREAMINSSAGSVGGLYFPKKKEIYIADSLPLEFTEYVIAHEFAHAFQDKVLDLDKFIEETKGNFDLSYARHAVLEGEATAVEFEYFLNKKDKSFKDLDNVLSMVEDKLFKDSDYVKKNIIYNIYGFGTRFIQIYLESHTWDELAGLYRNLPSSMEQVIHPLESYFVEMEKIDFNFDFNSPDGWEKVYNNKLGEYLIFQSLLSGVDTEKAKNASHGWGEDKIFVCKNSDDSTVIVLLARWDSENDSSEFVNAYKEHLNVRFPGGKEKSYDEYSMFESMNGDKVFVDNIESYAFVIWTNSLDEKNFKGFVGDVFPQLKTKREKS